MQYFFSFLPCALKVNGEYKGIISTEPKGLALKESDFIELLSPSSEFLPLSFLLSSPPTQVRRLCSRFGDFIYPLSFTCYPHSCEELYCFTHSGINLKVVCDGFCKIILSSSSFSTCEALPVKPTSCSVLFAENGYIGVLLGLNRTSIYVFELSSGKRVLFYQGDKITYNSKALTVLSNPSTILKHTVKTEFSSEGKKVEVTRGKDPLQLTDLQLKYAFLECVCIKDEVCDLLSEEIEASNFLSFIGKFDCIMPSLSPSHDFSLISDSLRFIKLEVIKGKICNAIID